MGDPIRKSRPFILSLSILCFCLLIFIWISFWHKQKNDQQEAIDTAIERNTNLAIALEQHSINVIRTADAVLQLVGMQYENIKHAPDIDQLLSVSRFEDGLIRGVGIVDEEGQVIAANQAFDLQAYQQTDPSEWGRSSMERLSQQMHISPPANAVITAKPLINIVRRVARAELTVESVIVQVEPSAFTSFYEQANLLPHDIISLIDPQGNTYARRTGDQVSSGENISSSPLFIHLRNNRDSFYFANDAIHGIPTYFSYRTLKDYPIIATVGRSKKDVFMSSEKRKKQDVLSSSLISLLIILFFLIASLLVLYRKKSALRTRDTDRQYQRHLTEQIVFAQERERELIGHELHDNVNQILTTVKLYLELLGQDKKAHAQLVEKSIVLINSSISEIRNLSHRLSAPTLGSRSWSIRFKCLLTRWPMPRNSIFPSSISIILYPSRWSKNWRFTE